MDHRDLSGFAVALVALVLAISGWLWSPPPAQQVEANGLDRWLAALSEPGEQVARIN